MAGKKGRSGRKKKILTAKPGKKLQSAVVVLPPAPVLPPVEIIPEVPQEKTMLEGVREKIRNLTPNISSESTEAEAAPAPVPPEFEVVAASLEEKYGGGTPGGSTEQQPVTAAAPSPALSFGVPGVAHVVTPESVEAFLVMVLSGMAKAYGPHWEPTEADKTVLVPVYTAAIDEQAPRWFADSPNKAAWLCLFVTVLFIVSRSKNGGKVIEWGMGKISSLVSRAGGSTKTD